jgi:hypothetical protein
LGHAVERLFIHATRLAGFRVDNVSADFGMAYGGFAPSAADATASAAPTVPSGHPAITQR